MSEIHGFERALKRLLLDCFTLEELRRHVLDELEDGRVIAQEIRWNEPLQSVADELVGKLLRRGCGDLWSSLRRRRPRKTHEIEAVRALSTVDCLPDGSETSARHAGRERSPVRRRRFAPNGIPRVPDWYVRRDAQHAELLAMMRASDTTLIAVVAPAGFGKSTLIAGVLREFLADSGKLAEAGGLLHYQVQKPTDVNLKVILDNAAGILGLHMPGTEDDEDVESADDLVQGHIRAIFTVLEDVGGIWIVIENFEVLLDPDGSIASEELLEFFRSVAERCSMSANVTEGASPVRFLLTSRVRPKFRLPGSAQVKWIDLGKGMILEEATRLLAGASEAAADPEEQTAIAKLAAQAHYIPLGLISVAQYARRGERALRFRDIVRERALMAAFDSFDRDNQHGLRHILRLQLAQLSAGASALLQCLSIFFGSAPAAVLKQTAALSDALFDSTLLALERAQLLSCQSDQVDIHAVVREVVMADMPPELRRDLHARAADAFHAIRKADPEDWLTLDDVRPQLMQVEHLMAIERYEEATEVMNAIQEHGLTKRGYYGECIALRMRLAKALTVRGRPDLQARNLRACGVPLIRMGQFDFAREKLELARRLAEKLPDQREHMFAWNNLGIMYFQQRRLKESLAHYEQALRVARERLRDPHNAAVRLGNISGVLEKLAEFGRARACAEEMLEIYRSIDPWVSSRHMHCVGTAWSLLAAVDLAQGDTRNAEYHWDLSAAFARAEGHARRLGNRLVGQGRVALAKGAFDRAIRRLDEAVSQFQSVGDKSGLGRAQLFLAIAWHHAADRERARRYYEEGASLRHAGSFFGLCVRWGILLLGEGRVDDAGGLFQDAVVHCERLLADTESFYEPLYVLPLARLALAHIAPNETEREAVLVAYGRAAALCSARGVVDSAAQDLALLAGAVGQTPLLREVCDLLEPHRPVRLDTRMTGDRT